MVIKLEKYTLAKLYIHIPMNNMYILHKYNPNKII